ncbi:MAG TPA: hypothetical protein PKD68_00755 [Candidatus Saccharibacteria bacterium]|nr:hypothetical protein [Candidatus Saccharibacteria bacterium]
MKTPASLNQLLQKEMDRKDFLKHTAAIALFVVGGGVIAQSLTKGMKLSQTAEKAVASGYGYGASAYGGSKARATQAQ